MLEARAAARNLHAYKPPLAGRIGLRLDFNESTIGILVRDRHSDPGCVRLTVGSNEHRRILIVALRDVVEQLGLQPGLRTELRPQLPSGVRS